MTDGLETWHGSVLSTLTGSRSTKHFLQSTLLFLYFLLKQSLQTFLRLIDCLPGTFSISLTSMERWVGIDGFDSASDNRNPVV